MSASMRDRLSPIAGVVTLAFGIGFVAVVQMVTSLFASAPAKSNEPFEILIARPGDNSLFGSADKLELSCYDTHIIPIWKELKSDRQFKERMEGVTGTYDCSSMIEVQSLDLNRDGRSETIARGKDDQLCTHGPAGSCGFWIFSNIQDEYRVLLSSKDVGDTEPFDGVLAKSRTRGYSDIVLKTFASRGDATFLTYVYNGRDYVESQCVYEVPKANRAIGSYDVVACDENPR